MAKPIALQSDLQRRKWATAVMVDAQKASKFSPYMSRGGQYDTLIYRADAMTGQGSGHYMTFPSVGSLSDPTISGNATKRGQGEQLKTFSNSLLCHWESKVGKTDTPYDRHDAGLETKLNEGGIRSQLLDFYRRWYDQYIFDVLQGTAARTLSTNNEGRATHGMRFDRVNSKPSFTYSNLKDIEVVAAEGEGFDWGKDRGPLMPMRVSDRYDQWLLMVDYTVEALLLKDPEFQRIAASGDVRGMNNKLFGPVIGVVGNLLVAKMPRYHGRTKTDTPIGYQSVTNAGVEVTANAKGFSSESSRLTYVRYASV